MVEAACKGSDYMWYDISDVFQIGDDREIIKILCKKDVKDIEGIPKLLLRLEGLVPIGK